MLSVVQARGIDPSLLRTSFIEGTVTGCCDFISQSILVRIKHVYQLFYLYFIHADH